MKRGLVVLDAQETPPGEHAARLDALRDRLRAEGLGLGLIYGDVSRSDDINYLTNLCVYWNEGVLAVPVDGDPAFVTKLSKRVHPWMRASSTLDDLRSGPDLAGNVAALIGERGAPRVGVVDRDWWPARLLEDLRDRLAASATELVAVDGAVREARRRPSATELELLARAGGILAGALDEAGRAGPEAAVRLAAVERGARGAGFLDVIATAGEGSDGSWWVDATGQMRHLWVRAARTADPALRGALRAAVDAVRPGARPSDLARAAGAGMTVRCIDHADLATGGDLRVLDPPDAPLRQGAVVALLVRRDGSTATAGDTVLVTAAGPRNLTEGDARGRLG